MANEKKPTKKVDDPLYEAKKATRLRQLKVLESPLSVIKMDISELRNFTNRLQDFLNEPGPMAIRICECCINVS